MTKGQDKSQVQSQVQGDSLIKEFKLVESDRSIYTYKIIFITVRGIELTYYTNSSNFVESLEKLKGDTFVIDYYIAGAIASGKDVENRIVKVKLPKTKS